MDLPPEDIELVRALDATRKVEVMTTLIRQAWDLKAAGIRLTHPHLDKDAVRRRARAMVAGEGLNDGP